jgi:endonuclease/exonuclease/phosphatase family metal-dependent hydrolase
MKEEMKIKLMQYNIRTGFRNTEKPYDFEGNRMELVKEVVKKEKPDILVLNEAYFESKNRSGILMDYQKIFNFPFYAHGNYKYGFSPFWGNAILSKYPIIEIENKNKGFIGKLSVKIKIKNSLVNLDATHISPIGSRKDGCLSSKGQEIGVKQVLKDKKKNYILAGDFNSLSPLDEYNENEMIESWSKIVKDSRKQIKEMLKRDAIKYVLSTGLVDSYKLKNKKFDFTIPTDFLSKDKSTGIRIDYLFCSLDLRIIESGIIKNKLTEQASDHYPTYIVLDM